jgi:uncharacterized protein (UPF0297 family)
VENISEGVKMMGENIDNTQYFKTKPEIEIQVKEVLDLVYNAMDEKGYNPVNQIVGYIMSGDPTYITSHKGARSMIMKVERDELVEELLTEYIRNRSWER